MNDYKSIFTIIVSGTMVFLAIFAIIMTIHQGRDFVHAHILCVAAWFSVLWGIEARRNLTDGEQE